MCSSSVCVELFVYIYFSTHCYVTNVHEKFRKFVRCENIYKSIHSFIHIRVSCGYAILSIFNIIIYLCCVHSPQLAVRSSKLTPMPINSKQYARAHPHTLTRSVIRWIPLTQSTNSLFHQADLIREHRIWISLESYIWFGSVWFGLLWEWEMANWSAKFEIRVRNDSPNGIVLVCLALFGQNCFFFGFSKFYTPWITYIGKIMSAYTWMQARRLRHIKILMLREIEREKPEWACLKFYRIWW